ncbi:MAG: hypothetical protein WD069_02580 [Planctomycetales bacterium]
MKETPSRAAEIEQERQELVRELVAEDGADWDSGFEPGTYGCHELFDRTHVVVNLLDISILNHPACIRDPQWYELASRALQLLDELYQSVGSQHLTDDEAAE